MTRIAKRGMTHSLSFDGSNDTVACGTLDVTAWTAITVHQKIRVKQNGTKIFFSLLHSGSDDIRIIIQSSTLGFATDDGSTVGAYPLSIEEALNNWVDITGVFDGSTVSVYINGSLAGTDTGTFDFSTADGTVHIGSRQGTAVFANGDIAETRIFNSALTADQVSNLYHSNIIPRTNLVAEYFNSIDTDGAGTVLTDSVGSNDGTISGATWSTEVPIRESVAIDNVNTHALSFDGVDDVVVVTSADELNFGTGSFTASVKVRPKDYTSQGEFMSKRDGANEGWHFGYKNSKIHFTFEDTDGNSVDYSTGPIGNMNDWGEYTIVFNRSDGVAYVYVDGLLRDTRDISSVTGSISTTDDLRFGHEWTFHDGLIDSPRIFSTALSPQQVYDLHYNNVVPRENLVAEYLLNEGAGTTAADTSGNENDGTISGATWVPASEARVAVPSVMPHVLRYDGVDDYTQLADNVSEVIDPDSDFSVHIDSQLFDTTSFQRLVSLGQSRDDVGGILILNDKVRLYDVVGGYQDVVTYDNLPTDKVRMLSVTRIGDTVSAYYNGLILGQGTVTLTESLATTKPIILSARHRDSGGFQYPVRTDVLRTIISAVGHTAEQVRNLHLHNDIPANGLVGNWNRISDDGTTLINSVDPTGATDGTITGATRVTDLSGIRTPRKAIVPYVGSVEFDGVDDDVDCGTIDITDWEAITISQKVQLTLSNPGGDDGMIFTLKHSGSDDIRVFYQNGDIDFVLDDGSPTSIEYTDGAYALNNRWAEITAVFDGTTQHFYVDGVLVVSGAGNFDFAGADGETHIGSRAAASFFSNCRIASTRIYNKALTTNQVEELYITNTTPYDNNKDICVLNLEAKTDVLSGSSWRDKSGNNNHGTITGATLSAERPHGNRKVIDGNLVKNGDFSVRPFLVAAQTQDGWLDGTATGSGTGTTPSLYNLYLNEGATGGEASVDSAGVIKLSTAAGGYVELHIGSKSNNGTVGLNDSIPSEGSKSYTVSGWMKTTLIGGDASSGAKIVVYEGNSAHVYVTSNSTTAIKTTTDWTYYEATFTTNASTVYLNVECQIYGHAGAATLAMDAYFTDIKLIEV